MLDGLPAHPPLIYQNKTRVLAISCTFASKSASELKTKEKASGRKKNRENGNSKLIYTFGPKNAKIPQKMAENLFKYSNKRGETG